MRGHRLPKELVDALHAVRRVERAAVNEGQRSRAVAATSRLMLAAVDAGWTVTEVATAAGMKRDAVAKRMITTRRGGGAATGVDVTPPLPKPDRLAVLTQPITEREWLTSREAWQYARVSEKAFYNWLRAGLLPNTDRRGGVFLVLKADLDRVVRAPRYNGQGVRWAAVRAAIAGSSVSTRLTPDSGT